MATFNYFCAFLIFCVISRCYTSVIPEVPDATSDTIPGHEHNESCNHVHKIKEGFANIKDKIKSGFDFIGQKFKDVKEKVSEAVQEHKRKHEEKNNKDKSTPSTDTTPIITAENITPGFEEKNTISFISYEESNTKRYKDKKYTPGMGLVFNPDATLDYSNVDSFSKYFDIYFPTSTELPSITNNWVDSAISNVPSWTFENNPFDSLGNIGSGLPNIRPTYNDQQPTLEGETGAAGPVDLRLSKRL